MDTLAKYGQTKPPIEPIATVNTTADIEANTTIPKNQAWSSATIMKILGIIFIAMICSSVAVCVYFV